MKTVRGKILLILSIISLTMGVSMAFFLYGIYDNYKKLQENECNTLVDLSTERINKNIRELSEAAKSMALCGYTYFYSKDEALAEDTVKSHFEEGAKAVGGGIWYEPLKFEKDKKRVCIYAYNDGKNVLIDKGFLSDEYDYHTQVWYIAIKRFSSKTGDVAWSQPYFDQEGTKSLMTTCGAGIFDKENKFVGMSTIDWKLDAIAEEISQIRPTKNSFSLFADTNSDYIMALTDSTMEGDSTGKSLEILEWFNEKDNEKTRFNYKGVEYISFRRTLDNGMTVVVNVPKSELFAEVNLLAETSFAVVLISSILLLGVTYFFFNYMVTKPIDYLSQKASEIGSGDFDTKIFIKQNDEFGKLAYTFNMMAKDIKVYVDKLKSITAEKESIVFELDLAKNIQSVMSSFALSANVSNPAFELSSVKVPAKFAGGDFNEQFMIDDEHLLIASAQLSYKGVPASLFMLILRTLFRNFAWQKFTPSKILDKLNKQIFTNLGDLANADVFLGILNIKTFDFVYSNAGNTPAFLSSLGAPFYKLDLTDSIALGKNHDTEYSDKSIKLKATDRLFLHTHVLANLTNENGIPFGNERIFEILKSNLASDIKIIIYQLRCALADYVNTAEQKEDIVIFGLSLNENK